MLGGLGTPELIVILVIVLVIFGPGKLPHIGDALGKTIRNFKKASAEDPVDVTPRRDQLPATSTPTAPPAPTEAAPLPADPARKG